MTPAERNRQKCRRYYFNHAVDFKVNKWKRIGIHHHGKQLTIDIWDALLELQEHKCALCGRSDIWGPFAADHDHETGELRGALCTACNLSVIKLYEQTGHFHNRYQASSALVDQLIAFYLANPPASKLR